jgi:hypothetical protein
VGTAFTYQRGSPVAGPCDFQFGLWDAEAGGSQAGSTLTKTKRNNGDLTAGTTQLTLHGTLDDGRRIRTFVDVTVTGG